MDSDIHNPGIFRRINIRSVILLVVCFVSIAMMWWMYKEQAKIHHLSTLHFAAEDKHHTFQLVLQPNISNEIKSAKDATNDKWDWNWDKKQWSVREDALGVGVRTLILIRHGQYDSQSGLLTDLGKQQANRTGARLKEMGVTFTRMVHSSLDRARETAQIIHKHLPSLSIASDDLLQEGGPVPPSPTITYWGLPERQYHVDGPRLESAFRKYFYRADKNQQQVTREILVGHGNIFRYMTLRALQLDRSAWMRLFIAHASITALHINPDSTVTATKLGDSGHFPVSMVTY